MPFESPDWPLEELLKDIHVGKIQLPDFQREWKWDVDRIGSLLASIGQGHPVGVLLMLQSGGDEVRFAPSPIAGANSSATSAPQRLLLDGQQRLTSLYQALFSDQPVDTTDVRGKKMKVWFYIDIEKALDPDADLEDDAIRAVPADRLIKENFGRDVVADYTTLEKECAAGVFPLARAFEDDFPLEYHVACLKLGAGVADLFLQFNKGILKNVKTYKVPVIELTKETSRAAVCTIFEKVNTGGVSLNVFELLTATFAASGKDFRLNDDWKKRRARMVARPVLGSVESTDFLQAVSLLASRKRRHDWNGPVDKTPGISCKRKDILNLRIEQYKEWAEPLTEAFIWAGEFLNHEHIFRARDLPYGTQLVPLAALRVVLGADADLLGTRQQLARWYWCGVLGEIYAGAVETRFARDLEQVEDWVLHGADEPGSVAGASFNPDRLLTLRTRNSAAYKGLYALTMREKVSDWMKHKTLDQTTFFDYDVDIHHIFPQAWCKKNGVERQRADSIINKTPLSRETNLFISGRAPSVYIAALAKKAGVDEAAIHGAIEGHHIAPELLCVDDFDAFFDDRRARLLSLIEQAMGKPVLGDDVPHEEFDIEEPEATDEPEVGAA